MADDSKQQIPNIGGNGFIWILLVAAGTYLVAQQIPLEGSRPSTNQKSRLEEVEPQGIEARLWQDPFAVVAEKLAAAKLKPENCGKDPKVQAHCESPLDAAQARGSLVLVAPVSAAPYAEDHEARRRMRYAVLAGLNVEGYAPADPQHIRFYWPRAAKPAQPPQSDAPLQAQLPRVHSSDAQAGQAGQSAPIPQAVPYEWFKPTAAGKSSAYSSVLVLWFDEDVLAKQPLRQFAQLLCPSRSVSPLWAKARILGPQTSTALQAMVAEVNDDGWSKDQWRTRTCPDRAAPQFYVHSATADDATLIPGHVAGLPVSNPPAHPSCRESHTCLSRFFDEKGIELHRMIATDEALAGAVRDELKLRGVDNVKQNGRPSHIALVSEWDTVYGRALPGTMARCLGSDTCRPANAGPPPWLHRYKYLRGLDGRLPDAGGSSAGKGAEDAGGKQDNNAKNGAKVRSYPAKLDRAEGQGQFDYLRRLGERIQHLDAQLQRDGEGGVRAVGVVGSDLYDKLLVLQALRPLLPNAWFFTTDLDALLLHPTEQKLTRNLLVASSFGLQLRPDVQGEIPPFRSSYQTAAFLATRVAIHSDEAPRWTWLQPPLLFEIGNSRTFQFAGQTRGIGNPIASESGRSDHAKCKADLSGCDEVQPLASAMYPQASTRAVVGVVCLALVIGLGLALTLPSPRRQIGLGADRLMDGAKSTGALVARGLAILLAAGAAFVALAAAIYALWPFVANVLTDDGQPIAFLEGTSVWPTVFLRAATLALCAWLIADGWRRLDKDLKDVMDKLGMTEMRERMLTEQAAAARRASPWIRFASKFGYRLPGDGNGTDGERLSDGVSRFWRTNAHLGRTTARLSRILAGVLVMGVLWIVLAYVFGNPHPPTRGEASLWAYRSVTFLLLLATLFLIFFVADATWLCWRVVKSCRSQVNVWPPSTLQQFSGRLGLPDNALYDWVDLVFLSKRTKLITTLIYSPFLIIALLLLSRSPLFANYGASIPDLATMGVGVLIVSGCAVALRWSAETSRTKTRRRLHDQMVAAKKLDDGGRRAGQLETLLRRVDELRDGAFSPFSQQPVVRAMLLPLGTLGGTALIEYLLPTGLL
jgi:hypothetical protein